MSQYNAPISRPVLYDPNRPNVRHPLTPPETDFDYHHSQLLLSQGIASAPAGLGVEMDPAVHQVGLETPTPSYHRKGPSVSYVNSTIRESRDRTVQRGVKWLIMVMPPASFAHEHGQLGSTLSSGPSHRLTNGILMPLYPTMSGQLGAISREFSLPSIAGICLYLNTTSAGVSVTPRITDETWTLLWAQYLDVRNPVTPQAPLPVCGRIEFDIDLNRARWYDAWLSASRREAQDVPVSVIPSRAPTISHWRGDSRTTFLDDQGDDLEAVSLMHQTKARILGRHVPRKLSLVDRYELSSVKSGSKLVPRHEPTVSPTEDASHRQQSLSPIAQEEEPRTARRNLDQLITTWRESASQPAPSPLAATGQTSLDPANMPNTVSLSELALDEDTTTELNLDDFAWSVSSMGPPEYDEDYDSQADWECDPSVHLADRLQGSVCLTPTTCTSFGPPDYDAFSPVSYVSRLPSPDIAMRMLEDCPPTPLTATSWGAPSYPNSPYPSQSRAPSVHMAFRGDYSRPATPSTATSWGAMDSYPPSPVDGAAYSAYEDGMRTPDAGERNFEYGMRVPDESHYEHWTLVWPYYRVREVEEVELPERWTHVWPYNSFNTTDPAPEVPVNGVWTHVWPYHSLEQQTVSTDAPFYGAYPYLTIYPSVYPAFDLYPALSAPAGEHRVVSNLHLSSGYPSFSLYTPVYPHFDLYPATIVLESKADHVDQVSKKRLQPLSCVLPSSYPSLSIYLAVYPFNLVAIYPSQSVAVTSQSVVDLKLDYCYPAIRIYAPTYPYNLADIYPTKYVPIGHQGSSEDSSKLLAAVEVKLQSYYPALDIYPSTYPHNLAAIYPSMQVSMHQKSTVVTCLVARYPAFNLYPSLYPHNLKEIYPPSTVENVLVHAGQAVDVRLSKSYPQLEIYPLVYPWNLQTIYAPLQPQEKSHRSAISTKLVAQYPAFDLYPTLYPFNVQGIYPCVQVGSSTVEDEQRIEMSVTLSAVYPVIELYAPVYPFNLSSVYPIKTGSSFKRPRAKRSMSHNNAVPTQVRVRNPNKHTSLVNFATSSSSLRQPEQVPPVPPLPQNVHQLKPISPWTGLPLGETHCAKHGAATGAYRYPVICPYPAVYPHFSLYPSLDEYRVNTAGVVKKAAEFTEAGLSYPSLQIYAPVYPHFDLYPALEEPVPVFISPPGRRASRIPRLASSKTPISKRFRKHTHADLHIQVFGRTPPSSPRQLPTPPGAVDPASISPRQTPPARMLRRSRSGTMMGNSSPPTSAPSSPGRRQLPTPPGGGPTSPMFSPTSGRILSPRQFTSPGTTRIPSPSPRPSPLSSPLPSVSELHVMPSPPMKSSSSPQRHIPAQLNLQASQAYRSPGFSPISLPILSPPPPQSNVGAGLTRTMSVPPRPLPRARSGSIAMGYARPPLPPVPDTQLPAVPT
ncbi:hypothetical protein EIP91_006703 [Steccherinum ochraceum]|uniref:Uncharacterized protein n=1 Tax=Steccherinum ochraceum TaxID=92696 RepID=A0A4R0RPN7_9APHY|nr:hypothetical protein EIP91_006703 [Steccherinum ochraceum]